MQKQLRLHHRTDFDRLRAEGKTHKHPMFTLSFRVNELTHNRYGLIISKRMGKAVVRNRLRRQLRACWRTLHPHLKQGYDLVLIPRPLMLSHTYGEFYTAIANALRQIRLMQDN